MVWALSLSAARLISCGLTPAQRPCGIRGLVAFGMARATLGHPAPYLRRARFAGLALKLFRGEPAISGFGWNFSSTRTSSPPFSTDVRADLQGLLRPLHPGHG